MDSEEPGVMPPMVQNFEVVETAWTLQVVEKMRDWTPFLSAGPGKLEKYSLVKAAKLRA